MAQQFDVGFKVLLERSRGVIRQILFGGPVEEWVNVEQPAVTNLRPDILARLPGGQLRHVEIQTSNDPKMGQRQLEYYSGFWRQLNQHVDQVLLYLGREPLRMSGVFETPSLRHEFRIVNLAELDGEDLLASEDWIDNELAILTRADRERALQVVCRRLDRMEWHERKEAASIFLLISGILGVEEEVGRRLRTDMINVMENKVLGPMIQRELDKGLQGARQEGREEGREEGRQEGRQEGRKEGAAELLERVLSKRFGPLPEWATSKLHQGSPAELEAWTLRLLEHESLGALLG